MKQENWVCKHCELQIPNLTPNQKANHSRWCINNPSRQKYIDQLSCVRHLSQTIDSRQKQSNSIRDLWKQGVYDNVDYSEFTFKGKTHSDSTKATQREKALKSTHRRLVKSTRKYICKDGSEVILDSSWEEALAKRLDELNISWIRPEIPIPWVDLNGVTHNYFPDFFLTKHNLYIDPKNPIAYSVQKAKIDIITKQLSNLIILQTLKECQDFNVEYKQNK
jgi:hypothetical protein